VRNSTGFSKITEDRPWSYVEISSSRSNRRSQIVSERVLIGYYHLNRYAGFGRSARIIVRANSEARPEEDREDHQAVLVNKSQIGSIKYRNRRKYSWEFPAVFFMDFGEKMLSHIQTIYKLLDSTI
jgi:hypothetical protein